MSKVDNLFDDKRRLLKKEIHLAEELLKENVSELSPVKLISRSAEDLMPKAVSGYVAHPGQLIMTLDLIMDYLFPKGNTLTQIVRQLALFAKGYKLFAKDTDATISGQEDQIT